jgi:TonB family protein
MIKNFSVPNPCHEKWDGMQSKNNGRYCDSCQKVVIDFTNKTEQEIIDYIAANTGKKMCGTFKTTQLPKPNHFIESPKQETVIRFLAALLLVFGMTLFSCNNPYEKKIKEEEPERLMGMIIPTIDTVPSTQEEVQPTQIIDEPPVIVTETTKTCSTTTGILEELRYPEPMPEPPIIDSVPKLTKDIVLGAIYEPMPEFIGGDIAFRQYIQNYIRYPETNDVKEGTVYIAFIVKKDGSIENVMLLRGIGQEYDEEAIRVVKAMPKWKPAMHNGKAIDVKMNIPIHFGMK